MTMFPRWSGSPWRWWLLVAASVGVLLLVVMMWGASGDRDQSEPPSAEEQPTTSNASGENPWPDFERVASPSDEFSGMPIIIAVQLSVLSELDVPRWIPGSEHVTGLFAAIKPREPLPPRTEAFVKNALLEVRERFNEDEEYDAPFTEPELRSLVSRAIAVDTEAGTATSRLIVALAASVHIGNDMAYEQPDTATPKEATLLKIEACQSLVRDEDKLNHALLSTFSRVCGGALHSDYFKAFRERHAATMPISPSTYDFWKTALPWDSDGQLVTTDVHRRAVAAMAHYQCETCTGADGGEDNGSPLSFEELDLREAIRTCAVDLGLEPGLHDLRVADDPLRLCVEEAGAYDVSRVIVQLLP